MLARNYFDSGEPTPGQLSLLIDSLKQRTGRMYSTRINHEIVADNDNVMNLSVTGEHPA
jgi:hypothetical protein